MGQFGTTPQRQCTLKWEVLHLNCHDLTELDRALTLEEIEAAVRQTPPEKAPGSDGYIWAFFKACWMTVKGDVVEAIQDLFTLRGRCARICLIPLM
jgi:hypothetical protein